MYNYLPAPAGSASGGSLANSGSVHSLHSLHSLHSVHSVHSVLSSTGDRSNAPSAAGSQAGSAPDSHISHGSMSQLGTTHYDWYHENEQATAAQVGAKYNTCGGTCLSCHGCMRAR